MIGKGMLDRIRRFKSRGPSGGSARLRDIYLKWKSGPNVVRLVGQFQVTKTHFVSPNPRQNSRGLCRPDVFSGEGRIMQVVNCLDWDFEAEEDRRVKTCPACKLTAIAYEALKGKCTPEEKKLFTDLAAMARPRMAWLWNAFDRDNPMVTMMDGDQEKKVLGYKIVSLGREAWDDVSGIFTQMEFDIADPDEGIDICVTQGHDGNRTTYSVQAVLDKSKKPPVAKMTPLTDAERACEMHNLLARATSPASKTPDAETLIGCMHEDLRQLLSIDSGDGPEAGEGSDPEVEAEVDSAISEGDGDGLLDGTNPSARAPVGSKKK